MYSIQEITISVKCCKHSPIVLQGIGTNEKVLIDIICSRSNEELIEIKRAYESEFKRLLESDVKSDTSGDFRRLLLALLETERDSSNHVDEQKAYEVGLLAFYLLEKV